MDLLDGRVVSNFIVQALNNNPITIYGDGKQTRSFCFVSDLIEAFVLLMESDSKVTGPINLGNPREFTMIELATKIVELTNSKSILDWLPLPADDPKQRKPDITIARNTLGWEPKIDLETGLRKTIDDFRARLAKS
jgi:UDP-glucuronate decarboxylase